MKGRERYSEFRLSISPIQRNLNQSFNKTLIFDFIIYFCDKYNLPFPGQLD